MLVGRVVGNVWATQKAESLTGVRMLLVRPWRAGAEQGASDEQDDLVVAADVIGAGVGETVLVAFGKAARTVLGSQDIAWQVAVVGIVDALSLDGESFELAADGTRTPT